MRQYEGGAAATADPAYESILKAWDSLARSLSHAGTQTDRHGCQVFEERINSKWAGAVVLIEADMTKASR